MYISQMAKSQRMMYQFINRGMSGGSQSQTYARMFSADSMSSGSDGTDVVDMLRSMGISGLEGRTVREMAQYQMRVQETRNTAQEVSAGSGIDKLSQLFSVREQYTPISEEATEAMQKLALEDAKNSIGSASPDQTGRANLIRSHLQDVDPSKRTASFNTMNKVWESELERIGNFIKDKDAGWNSWGDKFDTSILNDYKAGVNIWV